MKLKRLAWLGLVLASAVTVWAAEPPGTIALADAPTAVQKSIQAQIGAGKLGGIERTNVEGETLFAVTFTTPAGEERDLSVAADGQVLSLEVGLSETPAAVQKTIRSQSSGWELQSIDRVAEDEETNFDVTVSLAGREKCFTVADSGELVSMERVLAETPAAVQATVTNRVAEGSVKSIDEFFEAEGNTFEVVATAKDGARESFCVDAEGRLLSEEVTLEQTSPAVRKAIQAQLGDGKVLRIDKSLFERKAGVLPYEVQGRKDGQPFNFSIGPRGRFLGKDD